MKRLTAFLFALLLSASLGAAELQEILAGHLAARGGDNLTAVQTVRVTGRMRQQGGQVDAPFTWTWQRPNRFRLEMTMQGSMVIQADDGEVSWMVAPFMGIDDPIRVPPEQSRQISQLADFEGILIDSKKKGHDVRVIGEGVSDGRPAYQLGVTMKGGEEIELLLDKESMLIAGQLQIIGDGKAAAKVESVIGNYKEVDGVTIAHVVQTRMDGQIVQELKFETIEIGVEVEADIFAMPDRGPR